MRNIKKDLRLLLLFNIGIIALMVMSGARLFSL